MTTYPPNFKHPKTHLVPNCCECDKPLSVGKLLTYNELIIHRECYLKMQKDKKHLEETRHVLDAVLSTLKHIDYIDLWIDDRETDIETELTRLLDAICFKETIKP